MQSGAQHDLPGHQAEVLALAASAGMLFSGGKDNSIRAWQFDAASGTFRPTVSPFSLPTCRNGCLQTCIHCSVPVTEHQRKAATTLY